MLVSVCTIARNEEEYLPHLLEDITKQDYPAEQIEVVMVDSSSTDGTRRIMERFAEENPQYHNCVVTENPGNNQASGWNQAIRSSTGDIIIRLDAHGRIPEDFVSKNVECMESGEYVTGGPRPNLPEKDTPWQKLLLNAESSMFGSGIAGFRRENEKKYVKSMFHAAYRREVFEKVGLFNENLGRTEDNEMHYRIRQAGYRLCYDPQIHSWQYVRSSIPGMMKQKYGNGDWVARTLGVCPGCLSIYYFVPFAFVIAILVTSILVALKKPFLAIAMWITYWCGAIGMAILSVKNEAKHICQLLLPGIFFLLHLSYGVGSVVGMGKMIKDKITKK